MYNIARVWRNQKKKTTKFLKCDLLLLTENEQGTSSGVDTYFGLCKYPGREQRHRIDFKVL